MWAQRRDVLQVGIHANHVGDSGIRRDVGANDTYLGCAFLVRGDALDDAGFFRERDRADACVGFDVLLRLRAEGRVSGLTLMLGASSLIVLICVISLSVTLRVQPLDLDKGLKVCPCLFDSLGKVISVRMEVSPR